MLKPVEVKIKEEANVLDGKVHLLVEPFWEGVDRPSTGGIALPTSKRGFHLAHRLQRAMLDGAAFKNPHVAIDVNGQTYIAVDSRIWGKKLDADLKRLGY